MTGFVRGAFVAALMLITAAPALAQKVGYVDSRKILQEMPGRTQAEARMRVGMEALSARQKVMVDSLNVLMAAFEKDSASLSQADKVARFTTLQAMDGRYRDTLQVLEEEAQGVQAEAMQPLFDVIKIALEEIRQADGYAMIFDIGNQANAIVAMDKNLDVSDKVLARIRAMPTAAAPRPTPAQPAPSTRPPEQQQPQGPVSQPTGARRP
ncbi:MAG: OmpH family outer membrane protein [Gemmatimonadaceae bacterium]|nr:OmpH family outer membrane protein [Gemmatimonadaceae bacterium]